MTLIGAISIEGVVAKKAIKGSMKGKEFKDFIEHELVALAQRGAVVAESRGCDSFGEAQYS